MPGPPPPPPPNLPYGPEHPSHARDEVGPKVVAQLESLTKLVSGLQKTISRVTPEDTGVIRINTTSLQEQVKKVIAAEQTMAAGSIRHTIRNWGVIVSLVASAVAAATATIMQMSPDPAAVEARDKVEAQGHKLEQQVEEQGRQLDEQGQAQREQNVRIDRLERQQSDGFRYIGRKIDAISPRARPIEEPPTLRQEEEDGRDEYWPR
jgi:hypothetical protein